MRIKRTKKDIAVFERLFIENLTPALSLKRKGDNSW